MRPSTAWDRALSRVCRSCLVCRRARAHPGGWASRLVQRVESRVCPFCRAYERVYGRPAHEGPDRSQATG